MLVLLVALVGTAVYVDGTLNRTEAIVDYPERIADTPGTNWLIVGSDSRDGLTAEDRDVLVAGPEGVGAGRRTDTIMLVHIPSSGQPTLVSLPRDSLVPVPGQGRLKINAAFAIGGAPLLVQTVETVTGVHIDHYAEIGLAGFADLVDSVGTVTVCPQAPINDPLAGLNIPAGCQDLDGPQALGYVRTRATPLGDLDRVTRQREFVGALLARATSPGVLLNPFRSVPLVSGVADTVIVGQDEHVWHLARLGWALRGISSGGVVTTTVPFGGFETTDGGESAVVWNRDQALILFDALAQDRPVPPEVLVTGP